MTDSGYRTKEEAIVAAIDDMETGDKLTVHEEWCWRGRKIFGLRLWCNCVPQEWTCP